MNCRQLQKPEAVQPRNSDQRATTCNIQTSGNLYNFLYHVLHFISQSRTMKKYWVTFASNFSYFCPKAQKNWPKMFAQVVFFPENLTKLSVTYFRCTHGFKSFSYYFFLKCWKYPKPVKKIDVKFQFILDTRVEWTVTTRPLLFSG